MKYQLTDGSLTTSSSYKITRPNVCGFGGGGLIILFEAFITTGTVTGVALVLGLAVLAYAGGDRA